MRQRRIGTWLFLTFVILVGGSALALRWAGPVGLFREGSSPIERWCGDQVKLIAADLLGPELAFDDFDYEFPGTLTLRNIRFTDNDVVCLEASSMRLILRDVPTRGKPIVIDAIELTRPVVRLVVRDDGTLVGFTDFVKPSAGRIHDNGGSSRPSEFLAIRKMSIRDGSFRWTAANGTMMELDELGFDLNGRPDDDPGWYTLSSSLTRAGILKYTMAGRFQIGKFVLDLSALSLDLTLDETTQKNLPPSLQSLLARYEVQGRLAITGKATVPIPDPTVAKFDLKLALTNAHLASGRVQVPLDRLTMDLALSDQCLTIDTIRADVFGGHIEAVASIDFAEQWASELSLTGHELLLERALKETADIDSHMAGSVTLDGSASAPLQLFPESLDGSGQVTMKDGRLWGTPIYRGLMNRVGLTSTTKDSGSLDFALQPDRVELTKVRLLGDSEAVRGDGELFFDNRINFRFNAGRLEHVMDSMGIFGSVFQLATDRVVAYQVSGTWSDPIFSVRPFRLGTVPVSSDPQE